MYYNVFLLSSGLNHLIGTNLLRAYMHGYFMDIRLYQKVREVGHISYNELCSHRKIIQKTISSAGSMKKNLSPPDKNQTVDLPITITLICAFSCKSICIVLNMQ